MIVSCILVGESSNEPIGLEQIKAETTLTAQHLACAKLASSAHVLSLHEEVSNHN